MILVLERKAKLKIPDRSQRSYFVEKVNHPGQNGVKEIRRLQTIIVRGRTDFQGEKRGNELQGVSHEGGIARRGDDRRNTTKEFVVKAFLLTLERTDQPGERREALVLSNRDQRVL